MPRRPNVLCRDLNPSSEVRVDDMHEDMQLAIEYAPGSPQRWFKTDLLITQVRSKTRIATLDQLWVFEREDNLRFYEDAYNFSFPAEAYKHATYRDARRAVEDAVCQGLDWHDCEQATAGFDYYAPAAPPTEFGRVVDAIRWMSPQSGNDSSPIVVLGSGDLIDGWHRLCAARELHYQYITAYVGC
jgi:hypothetical protein